MVIYLNCRFGHGFNYLRGRRGVLPPFDATPAALLREATARASTAAADAGREVSAPHLRRTWSTEIGLRWRSPVVGRLRAQNWTFYYY